MIEFWRKNYTIECGIKSLLDYENTKMRKTLQVWENEVAQIQYCLQRPSEKQ